MKYILLALVCFLPVTAQAAMLADCDKESYEVTVTNGGASREVTLSPAGGVIREYGPVVSFRLKGHPPVVVHEPDEEYCIWSGKITLQRINAVGKFHFQQFTALMASPLIIPFFVWLFSWAGTWLALSLLSDFGVMDIPGARSNHTAPVPRGGGIAMVISILLFLAGVGMSGTVLLAAVVLAAVSFADDLKSLPVSVRLLAQCVAVAIAMPVMGGHIFPAFVPQWCEWIFIALLWIWFINLTNFMDGIDGITSIQTILVSVGICLVCEIVPSLPRSLAREAAIIAAAAFGFYWFNREPAKIFMGDVGSITLGFLTGYLLLKLAISGQWASALILPAYYISDATGTLCKRVWRGEKVWQAHSQHAYQQAVRSGFPHREVVCRISGLNVLLVMLAMWATVSMMTAIAMLIIAYGLTACLIRYFSHASFPG